MADQTETSPTERESGPGAESRTRELERQAYELRLSGATYEEIGRALGVKMQSAWQAVQRVLARNKEVPEKVAQLREIEVKRLDRMIRGHWVAAVGSKDQPPNEKSTGIVLKLMARKAALLGLDAPTKMEHAGPDGGPITMQTLLADFQRSAKRPVPPGGTADPGAAPEPGGTALSGAIPEERDAYDDPQGEDGEE